MAIRTIGSRLSPLSPLVTRHSRNSAEASRDRDAALEYRAWYRTARWAQQRLAIIWRDRVICAKCGASDRQAQDLIAAAEMIGSGIADRDVRKQFAQLLIASPITWVADHITPHRGDEALFWDMCNGQCLCKRCHDRDKQREEARDRRQW